MSNAERILSRAIDAGTDFIDTADVYSDGDSERAIGRFLSRTKQHRNFNREGAPFDKGETFSGVPYKIGLEAVTRLTAVFPGLPLHLRPCVGCSTRPT